MASLPGNILSHKGIARGVLEYEPQSLLNSADCFTIIHYKGIYGQGHLGNLVPLFLFQSMVNIKYNPETEKGKEKLYSWVREKKLKVTLDTFAEIYAILRGENPEFDFPDVGMPDVIAVSYELLLEGDEWDGET